MELHINLENVYIKLPMKIIISPKRSNQVHGQRNDRQRLHRGRKSRPVVDEQIR